MSGRATPSRTPSSNTLRPAPNAPYHPPSEPSTYRDLLLFEERLKSNAEMLRRRRRRYSIFLWTFVAALCLMGHKLLFRPPISLFALRALQASLAVVFITLALFFASGMYEEKIRYAHSYINHSNKALRPLNMHLNMRRPRVSVLSYIPIISGYVRPDPSSTPASAPASESAGSAPSTATGATLKPSVAGKGAAPNAANASGARRVSATPNVMATIPPSSNPRGELIFSSRVDRSFREGYERYRAAFERRREEKAREEARLHGGAGLMGWVRRGREKYSPLSDGTPTPPLSRRSTPTPTPPLPPNQIGRTSSSQGTTLNTGTTAQQQRRTTRTPSPASGLRHSLAAVDHDGGTGTGVVDRQKQVRERAESYSFVWTGPGKGRDTDVLRRAA